MTSSSSSGSTPSSTLQCSLCQSIAFKSRNQLFKHIKICEVGRTVQEATSSRNAMHSTTSTGGLINGFEFSADNNDDDGFKGAYLYVVGGRIRGKTLHTVERFSFKECRWEDCAPMLDNRGSHGAASLNNILYVVGGGGFRSNLSSCEAFDGSSWKYVAPMQESRHALAVVSAGDSALYSVGGWIDGTRCSNVVERYSPSTSEWQVVAPLLVARRLHGVAAYRSSSTSTMVALSGAVVDGSRSEDFYNYKIYIFGGHRDDPHWHTNNAEVYDPVSNDWRSITPMPVAGGASAATIHPFIFIFVYGKYVLRYDPARDDYLRMSNLPIDEWHCFDVAVLHPCSASTFIFVHGGIVNGKWAKPLYRYCAASDKWLQLPSMKSARRRCASAVIYTHNEQDVNTLSSTAHLQSGREDMRMESEVLKRPKI